MLMLLLSGRHSARASPSAYPWSVARKCGGNRKLARSVGGRERQLKIYVFCLINMFFRTLVHVCLF